MKVLWDIQEDDPNNAFLTLVLPKGGGYHPLKDYFPVR